MAKRYCASASPALAAVCNRAISPSTLTVLLRRLRYQFSTEESEALAVLLAILAAVFAVVCGVGKDSDAEFQGGGASCIAAGS